MPRTTQTAPAPPVPQGLPDEPPSPDGWSADLAGLRAELDRIDDAIHDLLMRRASVVARVGATAGKANSRVALRPGREAAIIRRLLARHHGRLPAQTLVRLWRELLAATTAMQAPFVIAVCDTGPERSYTQAAREHFGALTPLRIRHSPADTIAEVVAGTSSVAVLPLPSGAGPAHEAWWVGLLPEDAPRVHVVARLPFWTARPEGAATIQALVVAAIAPDPSGRDHTLIGLQLDREMNRADLGSVLGASGLAACAISLGGEPHRPLAYALVDAEGFLAAADPRLRALGSRLGRAVVLGAYAVPADGAGG